TSMTAGLTSSAGVLPAERTTIRGPAFFASRPAAICERPALCTQTNRTVGTSFVSFPGWELMLRMFASVAATDTDAAVVGAWRHGRSRSRVRQRGHLRRRADARTARVRGHPCARQGRGRRAVPDGSLLPVGIGAGRDTSPRDRGGGRVG